MCNNFPNIKVVKGNAFALLMPLKKRTFESCEPIDEDIDATQLTDLVVKFGGVEYQASTSEDGVQIIIQADIAVGTYSIVLTAMYQGSAIRAAYESAVTIVDYNSQSDAQQYIAGSPIVLDAAYVIGGTLTDAELEALKEEYREKNAQLAEAIADAEEAKREWEQKAADLDGVAQEATSQDILTAVENIDIDTTTLAKQGSNPEATNTAILTAVENIDIDTSDLAKQATLEAVGLDAASAKTAAEAAQTSIQQIINAHILGYNLGGYTFINGFTPEGAGSLLVNRDKISAIDDDNITSFSTISNELFRNCGNLTEVRYNNLVSIPNNAFVNSSVKKVYLPSLSISGIREFQNVTSVEEIDVRNLSTIPQEFVWGCSKLYYLNASNCSSLGAQCFRLTPSIIDMIIGGSFSGSMNFSSVYYDPSNAYSTSINTLCFSDDQDKYGRTFASNWEKWKWCIINHFAANLQDRTGLTAYTITFGSTVLSHFDAEMIAAFTDKNWTLA